MHGVVVVAAVSAVLGLAPRGFHRGVEPKQPMQRVVSLAPSATEMLFALGLGDRVVGVTRYCDRPEAAKALPKVGGFSDPSLEAIMALKPDGVVAVPSEANEKVANRLVELGVPVMVVPGTTLADVKDALGMLGKAFHVEKRAQELQERMAQGLARVAARTKGKALPRVLIVYDHRPLVVAGPGSFAHEVLGLAGGKNVVEGDLVAYPTLSLEVVASLAPDIILDASMGGGDEKSRAAASHMFDRFPSIPAVKNGRIHVLPGGTLMRPGPDIVQDVELLERLLHGK